MADILLVLLGFFFMGACMGSFLGTVTEKSLKRSFWFGRSQCMSCHTYLRWYELIPIGSFAAQRGKCRECHANISLGTLGIEIAFGVLWMAFGLFFFTHNISLISSFLHCILLSGVALLAWEDIRSGTIPDAFSIPLIAITIVIIVLQNIFGDVGLFPNSMDAFLGACIGMIFYALQITLPGILHAYQKKQSHLTDSLLLFPVLFPFWLCIKGATGEKRADKYIPSISKIDGLPTWVGGGDVRLGILIGLISGPLFFWWVIFLGYTVGTIYYLGEKMLRKKTLYTLPVAPLLFIGLCCMWIMRLFA